MIYRKTLSTREEWLDARKNTIGGSDAAALVGVSPWKNALDLYLEKTGEKEGDDLSDNDAVAFGNDCEPHLRGLFTALHPELKVEYEPNNIWYNDRYPFASASLDGWLTEKDTGRLGVLEIKTATIRNRAQREKWEGQIPQNYYTQVLWYLAVTERHFVRLIAFLRTAQDVSEVREYYIDRKDVERDIDFLLDAGIDFWMCIKNGKMPVVPLPKI